MWVGVYIESLFKCMFYLHFCLTKTTVSTAGDHHLIGRCAYVLLIEDSALQAAMGFLCTVIKKFNKTSVLSR